MRNFFKRLFGRNIEQDVENVVSPNLRSNVKKAILIIGGLDGSSSDAEIFQLLYKNGIGPPEARKILIFLPIAFCRRFLPDLKWVDEYFESDRSGVNVMRRSFSQTRSYTLIQEEVEEYFSHLPHRDVILRIAGRSSEFHVINDLLNAGGKMEDIQFTPMSIMW